MKPWKQALLISVLGALGVIAGLGAAMLAFGPGSLLGTPAGEWVYQQLFSAPANARLPDGRAVIQPGDRVPPLSLQDIHGQAVNEAFGKGQPVLINFWATWCPPCVEEMPLLDAFSAKFAEHGVNVMGIALDDPDLVTRYLAEIPVSFPIRVEESGPNDSSMLLGNARSVLPYSVLIDAQGRLQKVKLGAFRHGELEAWTAP